MRNTDKGDLSQMFPLPCETIPTRGLQEGVILKFKTFYLKIYDHPKDDSYIIGGYRFDDQNPSFEWVIPYYRLREFGKQFNREDGLRHFYDSL